MLDLEIISKKKKVKEKQIKEKMNKKKTQWSTKGERVPLAKMTGTTLPCSNVWILQVFQDANTVSRSLFIFSFCEHHMLGFYSE